MTTAKHPLATWREAQEPPLTQADLARTVGVTRWTINSIETGRRNASRDVIRKIIEATGGVVGLNELWGAPKQEGEAA